jgi:hypothetical protein
MQMHTIWKKNVPKMFAEIKNINFLKNKYR